MIRAGLFLICFVLTFALVPLVSSQAQPARPQDLQLTCDVDNARLLFQWGAVEGAQHYKHRLYIRGKRMLQGRTTETSVRLLLGAPEQKYTTKVRVKVNGRMSKWATVKTKCPPARERTVSFDFVSITRDTATVDIKWKGLPAYPVAKVYITAFPTENYRDCNYTRRVADSPGASNWSERFVFDGLCPDNGYMLELVVKHEELSDDPTDPYYYGLKREEFRTLP